MRNILCVLTVISCFQLQAQPIRILSLDSGALLCLFQLELLANLEEQTGQQVADLFDGFVGGSAGGIIAASLAKRIPAAELRDTFVGKASAAFNLRSLSNGALTAVGLHYFANYEEAAKTYEQSLQEHFGLDRMSEFEKPVLLPSFNTSSGQAVVFNSHRAKTEGHLDWPIYLAVRAGTALPWLHGNCESLKDAGLEGHTDPLTLSQCWSDLSEIYRGQEIVVYSIGSGIQEHGNVVYGHRRYPQISVVRIEPNYQDRDDTYVRSILDTVADWSTGYRRLGQNWDMNYMAAIPLTWFTDYIRSKAEDVNLMQVFSDLIHKS